MPEQDSQQANRPYGDLSLTKMAIKTIARGILETDYRAKGLPEPSARELYREAKLRYESSVANGSDDHLGTAERRLS